MSRKKQRVEQKKQKKRLRQKQREREFRQRPPAKISRTGTGRLTGRLSDAYDLIRRGDYDKAQELLQELDRRGPSSPEVVEALLLLYQKSGDRESSCEAARRLTKLCPSDAEARMLYAQESMFCGRAAIALMNYQEFIERWPNDPHVDKAKQAIEMLVPETERRAKQSGFPPENAFQCGCLHEESLALLQQGKYADCVAKCKDLLAHAPHFASARNNLAIACFQCGRAQEAVAVAEETLRMLPENRFAEATLAKLYFLTGRSDDAHRLADQIVANPPTHQASLVAALEALAFLGRDEDVVQLAESVADGKLSDQQSEATRLHYLAYAKRRLGDEHAANKLWKECLKGARLTDARGNLDDLKVGGGHAPWAASFGHWVPQETMEQVLDGTGSGKKLVLARYPGIASLIPALLDRGDPSGRQVAMQMAMADKSPPMLQALKEFGFGSRGPDELRIQTLNFLQGLKIIDAGRHRVYIRGKWTDVELIAAEVSGEPRHSTSSARVLELLERGYYAMRESDFGKAESVFSQALAEEPDNCAAAYNLCTVWLRRDGREGELKAISRLEQLHRDHPDYLFAAIALAQFAAGDGEFQRARQLLSPFFKRTQLHTSEAMALFTAEAQIALKENNIDAAKQAYDMLCEIGDKDDPQVMAVRDLIARASLRQGLLESFKRR